MNDLLQSAFTIQRFLDERRWKYCFIGGLAVLHWGEPRLTRDIDITLVTGFGDEEVFVDALLKCFPARIPNARDFALENRTLLIASLEGHPINIALGGLPFELRAAARANAIELAPNTHLRLCAAEDLIVMKVFANRVEDWRDVEGILIRQNRALDVSLLLSELRPLLAAKEDRESEKKLNRLLLEYGLSAPE